MRELYIITEFLFTIPGQFQVKLSWVQGSPKMVLMRGPNARLTHHYPSLIGSSGFDCWQSVVLDVLEPKLCAVASLPQLET